ncbi:MAG: tetratricopeptide repeat protein, partial [Candidatus Aminicenantes bacterium]|nr:tetratricopeptide repeat protein [Candidatus Aminicenantes bacterium]
DRIAVDKVWNLLRLERADKAENEILKLGESHPFFWTAMGYVALIRNDVVEAEADFHASLRSSPDPVTSHLGLGQAYRRMGRREEALRSYMEVLKYQPGNSFAAAEAERLRSSIVDALTLDAAAAARAGNDSEAKTAFLKILEYAPKLQSAHLALARIFTKEKNYQGALFHLGVAQENDPSDKAVLLAYAEAHFQMNQLSKSLSAYERLAAVDPNDKAVAARIAALKTRLGVVDLPDEYKEIPFLEAVTKEDVAALIAANFASLWAEINVRTPVLSDISASWARSFIVKVAGIGVMEVYSNHTFQPKKIVTRAEMAEIVVRFVDYLKKRGRTVVVQIPPERIQLPDVPPEYPYAAVIIRAVSYQLMDLFPDRTFRPDRPMSGAEAIRILDLLAGLSKEPSR